MPSGAGENGGNREVRFKTAQLIVKTGLLDGNIHGIFPEP
jgi:hypothetical protein